MGLSFVGPLDIEGLKLEVFVVKCLGRGLCVVSVRGACLGGSGLIACEAYVRPKGLILPNLYPYS